jgi:putative endopeptidase
MRAFSLLCLLFFILPVFADSPETKGIEISDMNKSIDPCTDFYEYANGNWRANNPIPPTMTRWSRRFAAAESTKDQLKEILEQTSAMKSGKGSIEQLTGDFYASCMDDIQVNQLGIQPIKSWWDKMDAIKSRGDIQKNIEELHRMGVAAPFGLTGSSDNHNPTQVIANLYASGLGLPDRDYYLKEEDRFTDAREKYRGHVAEMFKLMGATPEAAVKAADVVFDMEKKLAQATYDRVKLRDPEATDHKTAFADLQKLTPNFNWKAYFTNAGLNDKVEINVQQPEFLQEVNQQIEKESLDNWKIYLKWQFLNTAAAYLSDPLVTEDWKFYRQYLAGAKEMKPRWKRCVEFTDLYLGEALGKKYTEKYFPPEAKARMQDLVKNLLLAMKDDISSRTWMSDETKKKAMEKIATFNPKIGYPDKWKDYSKVPISRDSFWENVVAGAKFNVQDDWTTIGKPVDRGKWGMTPPTSNAYYNPLLNEIVFPAGILQPPAFSVQAINAVNYGAIGVVIGHEISHGFDDQGAQYDAEGKLKNWWTEADLKQFQERGACVADQFDHYFIEEGVHHNGKLVLGESIGDLGGAKIAYLAWKKSQEGKPVSPNIDGFTPEQQFFIAWGQFRGDAIRIEQQRVMVQSDPHPTGKYRVNGPLSNMPEFQQAFSCKEGSAMVRPADKRCEVW